MFRCNRKRVWRKGGGWELKYKFIDSQSKIRGIKHSFLMELFIALGFPIVLLVGLTLLFMTDGIPSWVQQFNRNSSTLWNMGILLMSTMALITYLARR